MSFDDQPTLQGRCLWLRPLDPGDFNGEMKRLMCEHAFEFVDSVVLLVAPGNVRSQRAAEKVGGVGDGERWDAYGRTSHVYRIR